MQSPSTEQYRCTIRSSSREDAAGRWRSPRLQQQQHRLQRRDRGVVCCPPAAEQLPLTPSRARPLPLLLPLLFKGGHPAEERHW